MIRYRVRARTSQNKTKIKETQNNLLILENLKVVDLVKRFKVIGNVSGPPGSLRYQTPREI